MRKREDRGEEGARSAIRRHSEGQGHNRLLPKLIKSFMEEQTWIIWIKPSFTANTRVGTGKTDNKACFDLVL